MDIEKLKMESKDLLSENIEKVAELFPNCLVESEEGKKIDFDLLRQELSGDIVDGPRERYHLDFPGKREAIVESNRKITKTLRPVKDKSVNFETTKNIYIEGDNLEALKILQESYLGKIKCIYIDPPYNTGNDFVYNDDFSHSEKEELKESGVIDEDGNVLASKETNNESKGRFHSNWLKMMYPRLKLARNLLSDDGVIFISIDDSEVDNLRKLCDEIYGENNFSALFIWKKTNNPNTTYDNIGIEHEYIACYVKNKEKKFKLLKLSDDDLADYIYDDNYKNSRGPYKLVGLNKTGTTSDLRPNLMYDIIAPDGSIIKPKPRWRWSKEKFENGKIEGRVEFRQTNGKWTVYYKQYLYENNDGEIIERGNLVKSIIDDCGRTTDATLEIKNLFEGSYFDFPKPECLLKHLVYISNGETILDFFSGSATTAHAVMKLNAEDGGNRQFIMVQLPEATDENSEAYKAGFKNICDIGEERIRRAGKKILEESKNNVGAKLASPLDIGFRVYKIDESNMKDIYYKPDEIDQKSVLDYISNVKEDRTALDLLTQVMLNLGLTLDLKIEEKKIDKNLFYFVEDNALVACFDDKIDLDSLSKALECKPLKIVCKESSFEKDQDKINFNERIKKHSPETEKYII